MGEGGFARLRTGHLAALTCHRHVIHYRSASNPFGYCELPVPAWGEFEGGLVIPPQHNSIILAEGVPPQKRGQAFACPLFGGGRWIRTTEGIASRFTVCPLWPLGNSPISICVFGGAGGRTRTPDLLITNQLLYRLSYTSVSISFVIIAKRTCFVNRQFIVFFNLV